MKDTTPQDTTPQEKAEEEAGIIYLEPRNILDTAIINQVAGVLHYDYDLLVECFVEQFSQHGEEQAYELARDWISYNIIGTYMEGWPKVVLEGVVL